MKIGILTFFESQNYGTALQAYALQKYLTDCGHDAELVHIKREANVASKHFKTQTVDYSFVDRVFVKIRSIGTKKKERIRDERFEEFRYQYLNISPIFYETDIQLVENIPEYDLYISGGDQIWNPYHKVFSTHYFWDFLPEGKKIASFSSSFGVDRIDDQDILAKMKEHLKRYCSICVREQSGVEIVESMGLQAVQVLDPVFLLSEQWRALISEPEKRQRYCLVYALVDYPREEDRMIKEYARKNGLIVKIIPNNRRNCLNNYVHVFDAGPVEFLNLIANAEYVYTNSFHGLAFSLIFNKQFHLLSTVSDEGNSKRDRLTGLLKAMKINKDCYETDYVYVNQQLDKWKIRSMKMIESILN